MTDHQVHFELVTSTPAIGAEIVGLDLREELSPARQERLRRSVADRGVRFLPGQQISPDGLDLWKPREVSAPNWRETGTSRSSKDTGSRSARTCGIRISAGSASRLS